MRELSRGVLFFGVLALMAVAPTAAQGTPDNMECDGLDCSDAITVTDEDPNDHNYSVPIYVPPFVPPLPPPPAPPPPPVFGGNNPPPVNGLGVTPFTPEEAKAAGDGLCSFLRNDAVNGFRQVLLGGLSVSAAAASYLGTTSVTLLAGAAAVGVATIVYGLCLVLGAG